MSKSIGCGRHMGQHESEAVMMRHRGLSEVARPVARIGIGVIAGLVWLTGCLVDNSSGPCTACPPPPAGLIVSNPVPSAALASNGLGGESQTGSSGSDVVYVSLVPGTAPTGIRATVRRFGDPASVTTAVIDGGFDPVPVTAQPGDSIEVTVTDTADGTVLHGRVPVPANRPPVVIRTDPPPRKRDVPLNTNLVIVFSEPVQAATLNTSSVLLLKGGSSVGGTVDLLQGTSTGAVFTPDTTLDPNTDYRLIVTTAVQDLEGDPLSAADTVQFTTAATIAGPPVRVRILPHTAILLPQGKLQLTLDTLMDAQGHILSGLSVSWSNQNPSVATVAVNGLVTGVREGVAQVIATVESVSDTATITVAIPPASEQLAFVRAGEIYRTATDGSFQIRLTNSGLDDRPRWSPDGSRIVFTSGRDESPKRQWGGGTEIYVMNADGSGQVNLTANPATDAHAEWSPDGSKIVFISDRDGPPDGIGPFRLYVMNSDGSGVTRLTNDTASQSDVNPTWSPDGSKIAFASARGCCVQIYVMNADGSGPMALTSDQHSNQDPAWSPDGLRIAFTNETGAVVVMNADGTGARTLTIGLYPQWSPDGSKIAFYVDSAPPRASRALARSYYVINADGSGLLRLIDNPPPNAAESAGPSWSPDGSRVAFVSTSGGIDALYVAKADGSGLTDLTNSSGAGYYPVWKPR